MCEASGTCKARAGFWARRDSANLLVCGRHLASAVRALRAMTPEGSDPSYGIGPSSSVVVKVRDGKVWR